MHLIAFFAWKTAIFLAATQHEMHFVALQHAVKREARESERERKPLSNAVRKGLAGNEGMSREKPGAPDAACCTASAVYPKIYGSGGALLSARAALGIVPDPTRIKLHALSQAPIKKRRSPGPCRSAIAALRHTRPERYLLAGSLMHAQRARTSRMSRKDCSTVRPDVSMMASALLYMVVRPARMRFKSSIASWFPCMGR